MPARLLKEHHIHGKTVKDRKTMKVESVEKRRRKLDRYDKNSEKIFVNVTGWESKKICCGNILVGPDLEVIVDPRLFESHQGPCFYKQLLEGQTDDLMPLTHTPSPTSSSNDTDVTLQNTEKGELYSEYTVSQSSTEINVAKEFGKLDENSHSNKSGSSENQESECDDRNSSFDDSMTSDSSDSF